MRQSKTGQTTCYRISITASLEPTCHTKKKIVNSLRFFRIPCATHSLRPPPVPIFIDASPISIPILMPVARYHGREPSMSLRHRVVRQISRITTTCVCKQTLCFWHCRWKLDGQGFYNINSEVGFPDIPNEKSRHFLTNPDKIIKLQLMK